jgi:hypothetical protein
MVYDVERTNVALVLLNHVPRPGGDKSAIWYGAEMTMEWMN